MLEAKTATIIRELMEAFFMRSMTGWRQFVKSTGLSMPQFGLLMRLYYGGGCEVHDLGRHLDVSSAAASQLVDRLVQSGLVQRTEDPEDRRARQVTMTAKARALIDRGIEERYRWVDELVRGLNGEERDLALRALPALIQAEQKLPAVHRTSVARDAIRTPRERH